MSIRKLSSHPEFDIDFKGCSPTLIPKCSALHPSRAAVANTPTCQKRRSEMEAILGKIPFEIQRSSS
jgi:hypothetical protein